MHIIAAKAVAFLEALQPDFPLYQQQILRNARAMADLIMQRGYHIVSNGTDDHLMLIDLIAKNMTGKEAEKILGEANITTNKNAVPNDPQSPFITSGIRIGSPAITTRGFKEQEAQQVATWICDILDNLHHPTNGQRIKKEVLALCQQFPVYGHRK
jgi:glycine hydroxymethyltransferase